MSFLIDVFIPTQNDDIKELQHLLNIFNDDRFNIQIIHYKDYHDIQYDDNYSLVKKAISLRTSQYIIICHDYLTTVSSSKIIADTLQKSVQLSNFDIFYLAKYADSCQQYYNRIVINDTGLNLVSITNPHGCMAFMLTPTGISKFEKIEIELKNDPLSITLNSLVKCNKFLAVSTSPTLLNINVSKSNDYLKTIECISPFDLEDKKMAPNLGFFWIIIVLIFITFVIYISVKYIPIQKISSDIK